MALGRLTGAIRHLTPTQIFVSQRWFSKVSEDAIEKKKNSYNLFENPLFDINNPNAPFKPLEVFEKGDFTSVLEDGTPLWHKVIDEMLHQEVEETKLKTKGPAPKSIERHVQIDARGCAYGTGRRKTSTARVWVSKSKCDGQVIVNRKDMVDYFSSFDHRKEILMPFVSTSTIGQFDVKCIVNGGGLSGQAGAIRHGISRALQNFNPDYRPNLKKDGLLTRDPRMVERKKPGRAKARKRFQWVKR